MAKLTLPTVKSGYNLNQINDNFQTLVNELQNNVQYRNNPVGEPNQWETQQDANSQRLINLPDAVSPSEPATLRQINALSVGVQSVGISRASVTATDGQTVFATSSYVPGSNNLSVYINGVRQDASAYTETSATSFTLSEGVDVGDNVEYIINEYPELAGTQAASSVTYTYPGTDATNVQAALDELKGNEYNIKDHGGSPSNSNADNKTALDVLIQTVDAAGGGVIYIPYDINYGFRLADPDTWPDLSSITVGDIVVKDNGQINNEGSGRVGAQTRIFYSTPATTPAGQHDGNGFAIHGKWHPHFMVTNYEPEETGGLSPYRASFLTRAINDTTDAINVAGDVEIWGMGQRNATAANSNFSDRTGFKIYTSRYIYDTVGGNYLNTDATAYAVDRYSGCQAFNSGVDRGLAYQFFLPEGIHSNICTFKGETADEIPEFKLEAIGTTNNYRLRPDATNADYQLSVGGTVRTSYDINGNVHIGDGLLTTAISEVAISGLSEGNEFFRFIGSGFQASARYFAVTNAGSNGNAAAIRVGTNSSTSRSINAGGTINASGADYAEYEDNNGNSFEKGDVVGFDSDGKLTKKFSESIRFGIKSTDPSYVGGDTWGNEDTIGKEPEPPLGNEEDKAYQEELALWNEKLEAARAKVDRIAYSGKVPVNNVTGKPGDYVVALSGQKDTIKLTSVSNPSFEEYRNAIGRVNRILEDGRLEVAVIVH